MDTEKCRVLLCAIEQGNLTAAAEQLGYTTSGVSRMMVALESEIGVPLLIRSRQGVVPTDACQELIPSFRELIYWSSHCEQLSAEIRGLETGSVFTGSAYGAFYPWLSSVIAGFRAEHPNIEVRLLEGSSSSLCQAMQEHRADFCIISQREGDYTWIPLLEDPLVAWVPENHPLASLAAFPVQAFQDEPFIDTFPGQDTDNARLFAKLHLQPNIQFTSTESRATYAMVEAGLGISLYNALTAQKWTGHVRILPLDPPQTVSIGIAVPRDDLMSPAARKFSFFAKHRIPACACTAEPDPANLQKGFKTRCSKKPSKKQTSGTT